MARPTLQGLGDLLGRQEDALHGSVLRVESAEVAELVVGGGEVGGQLGGVVAGVVEVAVGEA